MPPPRRTRITPMFGQPDAEVLTEQTIASPSEVNLNSSYCWDLPKLGLISEFVYKVSGLCHLLVVFCFHNYNIRRND